MALDPSKAGERLAANDAAYDDDPTAELDAPITCELEEQHIPGPALAEGPRDAISLSGSSPAAELSACIRPPGRILWFLLRT